MEQERKLAEDLELLKILMTQNLGVQGTELQQIAGYWIPELIRINKALVKVNSWGGQYAVNDAYRPIAQALANKYEEISHVKVNEILFIDNTTGSGTTLDKRKNAQISKLPGKWRELLTQMTGRSFYYMMEFYKTNIFEMSREQVTTLIYHELRHIDADGDLRHHDIEEWAEVAERLGVEWSRPHLSIPDLLDDDVDWDSIQRRDGLFSDPEPTLKLVKNQ